MGNYLKIKFNSDKISGSMTIKPYMHSPSSNNANNINDDIMRKTIGMMEEDGDERKEMGRVGRGGMGRGGDYNEMIFRKSNKA